LAEKAQALSKLTLILYIDGEDSHIAYFFCKLTGKPTEAHAAWESAVRFLLLSVHGGDFVAVGSLHNVPKM
jgi:hypothetical protein